jgi:hypothetical protein
MHVLAMKFESTCDILASAQVRSFCRLLAEVCQSENVKTHALVLTSSERTSLRMASERRIGAALVILSNAWVLSAPPRTGTGAGVMVQ